jgi:RNA polymerase sigma factor (sigma-70 family)
MATNTDSPRGELPGDPDAAIRQLHAQYAPALHRYVERFCPDRASADDIVQETFIRAWRHLPQLRTDDRLIRPWLFRVARNLLTDANRAARARPMMAQEEPTWEAGTDSGLDRVLDQQLLPGRDHGGGRPRAGYTARDGQVTAALRARCTAPAVSRARRDRALMTNCLRWYGMQSPTRPPRSSGYCWP